MHPILKAILLFVKEMKHLFLRYRKYLSIEQVIFLFKCNYSINIYWKTIYIFSFFLSVSNERIPCHAMEIYKHFILVAVNAHLGFLHSWILGFFWFSHSLDSRILGFCAFLDSRILTSSHSCTMSTTNCDRFSVQARSTCELVSS